MAAAGQKMITIAKENGNWTALDEGENLVIPEDLVQEFAKYDTAARNFDNFPRSIKREILEWLFNAKRTTTRQKRIKEIAIKADKNVRANQYQRK